MGSATATDEPAVCEAVLEGRQLAAVRHDRTLFTDLGFRLRPGEMLQVAGPNASGKTTLLRILCGLSWSESGRVLWRGRDIAEQRAAYAAELAYLGHAPAVKADLTAAENLSSQLALGSGARAGVGAHDALARVGLGEWGDVSARSLSAGQQRRLALARLVLSPARLWVLDEPFTALDHEGRALVEELLRAHVDDGGLAVLTTHQPLERASQRRVHRLEIDPDQSPDAHAPLYSV